MVQRNELGGIDGKAAGRAAEVGYVPPQMELAAQLYAADRNRPIGQGSRTGSGTTASDSESSESHSSNSSSESDASSSDARCLTSVADARVLVYMAVAGCAASMLGGF
ncbi:hypothetical protein IWQ57_004326 [Coemansia nantahalensis]|uniref:Uncharacterized protein n=1 Tax=Coemansia nantahalensis TaxID=2789366 RepID=A0ACC1JSP2_9FUNG|nr:hypothetical protein IWQ57_004326 [Coemansia nantahalensis]